MSSEDRAAKYILLVLILFNFCFHLPQINRPPYGFHQWRQAQTLAVARNFYEESMDVFAPRVDGRGNGDGVTGMEFPVLNYIIACSYRLFGFSDAAGRLVALVFGALAILGIYLLGSELFGSRKLGAYAAIFLTFSPLFLYYSAAVMPDVPMLSMLFYSLYFFTRWKRTERSGDLALAAVFLGSAGLIKIAALIAIPYFVWILIREKRIGWRTLGPFVIPLGAICGWYLYARHLSSRSGIYDFKLGPTILANAREFFVTTYKIAFSWLPEVYMNYGSFLFLVLGLIVIARRRAPSSKSVAFTAVMSGSLAIYMLTQYPMLLGHDYYMVPILAVLPFVAAMGLQSLLVKSRAGRWFALVFLGISMAIGIYRVNDRYRNYDRVKQAELQSLEPYLDAHGFPVHERYVVCHDASPAIYLYFAHRKGWAMAEDDPLEKWESAVSKGAGILVSDSRTFEQKPGVKECLKPIGEHGGFRVFSISPPNQWRAAQSGSSAGARSPIWRGGPAMIGDLPATGPVKDPPGPGTGQIYRRP